MFFSLPPNSPAQQAPLYAWRGCGRDLALSRPLGQSVCAVKKRKGKRKFNLVLEQSQKPKPKTSCCEVACLQPMLSPWGPPPKAPFSSRPDMGTSCPRLCGAPLFIVPRQEEYIQETAGYQITPLVPSSSALPAALQGCKQETFEAPPEGAGD